MKGIILAGGNGTRLHPMTYAVSKQLMPIYDKPMIYYPLSTLMLAGIRDILIITTPHDAHAFKTLLGDGTRYGVRLSWITQEKPGGLAQAFLLGERFIADNPVCLILGDNIFYGADLSIKLQEAIKKPKGAKVFAYEVANPGEYGVVTFDETLKVIHLEEKPQNPQSNWAVTGLYFYDNSIVTKAKSLKPSKRNELEITDINHLYLQEGSLSATRMGRGYTWLDTGRPDDLHEAASFVRTIQHRTGMLVGSPEEVAYRKGWKISPLKGKSQYYKTLKKVIGS